ncbi:GNAT family N-acetyltransferase [Bacillus luteolus]|uniref:GNAT family N-acetyltransferase n=1 Tax=Litchfieldia luteola TaxID=682179 RepID=A0ABR9QM74_9BACI|nr:GNAT family N-acetyltransferase [Cytobacillus luteolus]MBE4909589.1 GNAT family N-acetyltransferase [Cytobacillus luteolus]MBP1940990.1 RimJ/RimL family protein N-acetyltransferase [Cytobacillus luteolus]
MLETNRLLIRELGAEDAEIVEELAGDYDIAKTTLSIPHPYPKGGAIGWISSVKEHNEAKRTATFATINKEDNQLIGVIGFNLHMAFNRGEINYWIGKPHWGKGYATEAAKKMVHYGFHELGLNRIYAASFTSNPGSWKVMEKLGMKHEGTFKQHVKKGDEYIDLTYYGMVKEDYVV